MSIALEKAKQDVLRAEGEWREALLSRVSSIEEAIAEHASYLETLQTYLSEVRQELSKDRGTNNSL